MNEKPSSFIRVYKTARRCGCLQRVGLGRNKNHIFSRLNARSFVYATREHRRNGSSQTDALPIMSATARGRVETRSSPGAYKGWVPASAGRLCANQSVGFTCMTGCALGTERCLFAHGAVFVRAVNRIPSNARLPPSLSSSDSLAPRPSSSI